MNSKLNEAFELTTASDVRVRIERDGENRYLAVGDEGNDRIWVPLSEPEWRWLQSAIT